MRPDNDLGLRVFGIGLQIGPKCPMDRRIVLCAGEDESAVPTIQNRSDTERVRKPCFRRALALGLGSALAAIAPGKCRLDNDRIGVDQRVARARNEPVNLIAQRIGPCMGVIARRLFLYCGLVPGRRDLRRNRGHAIEVAGGLKSRAKRIPVDCEFDGSAGNSGLLRHTLGATPLNRLDGLLGEIDRQGFRHRESSIQSPRCSRDCTPSRCHEAPEVHRVDEDGQRVVAHVLRYDRGVLGPFALERRKRQDRTYGTHSPIQPMASAFKAFLVPPCCVCLPSQPTFSCG
jgi:hypothetical protein